MKGEFFYRSDRMFIASGEGSSMFLKEGSHVGRGDRFCERGNCGEKCG